jgi:DNA-binding transcriptional regulator YdaS (Cro superfamily)
MQQSEFLLVEDVLKLLRAEIAAAGSQSEWARIKGVNRPVLNYALRGRRKLQPKILKALGLEKVTVYKRL